MQKEKIHIHKHYNKNQINKGKLAIFIAIILIIIAIIIIFFMKNENKTAKNFKIGNNTTSQEIIDNILNISSCEAKIEVDVKSNKNENKYVIKQKYEGDEKNMQEIIEPSNIAGVKIIRDGTTLKLENTNLNLTSIYENYEYISESDLDLSTFIKDYKNGNGASIKEKNEQIILKVTKQNKEKELYISKETGLPTKMEIRDNGKNVAVYILYNEVNVNS